jgi:hypothetical protein
LGVGGKKSIKKENKRKARQTHPAQWMGLKALITGLGVGGRKVKTITPERRETKENPAAFKSQTDPHTHSRA